MKFYNAIKLTQQSNKPALKICVVLLLTVFASLIVGATTVLVLAFPVEIFSCVFGVITARVGYAIIKGD